MNNSGYAQAPSPSEPSPQMDSRKQKRHYPRFQAEQTAPGYQPTFQQPHSPFQQPQAPYQQPYQQQQTPQPYASPVPSQATYQTGYNQALHGMANLSTAPQRQDVSLVGQPALIKDLKKEISGPTIPLEVYLSF